MSHAQKAEKFINNKSRMHWHDESLWFVRSKRDIASKKIPEWEQLRKYASQIKSHTMSSLDYYLEEFERNAINNGIKIHWAIDANEHNEIVYNILKQNNAKKIVKSKSMLTEECHLNPYLEDRNIEVIDTDLGERIIQLRDEKPSHIVLPAIHLKKEEVSATFHKHLKTHILNSDPKYLTNEARKHLREKFLNCDAAITGVNFAISQTGGIVVCTNEGNADFGTSIPKLHIASMGIEKVIPRFEDLGVFIRLLARSATGQEITTYTSHYQKPKKDSQLHIVIVDNKRSDTLSSKDYQKSLNCIRCGACMNTCPVYRRSGGHSYDYVIPGPIGSILGAIRQSEDCESLPFACTLCSSCTNVCPVKIDLDQQLYTQRQDIVEKGSMSKKKRLMFYLSSKLMLYPKLFSLFGFLIRIIIPIIPNFILYSKFNIWAKYRKMPKMHKQSFKQIYKNEKAKNVKS